MQSAKKQKTTEHHAPKQTRGLTRGGRQPRLVAIGPDGLVLEEVVSFQRAYGHLEMTSVAPFRQTPTTMHSPRPIAYICRPKSVPPPCWTVPFVSLSESLSRGGASRRGACGSKTRGLFVADGRAE